MIGGDAVDRRQGTKVPKTERIITRAARSNDRLQPNEDKQDRKRRLGQLERFLRLIAKALEVSIEELVKEDGPSDVK